MEYIYKDLNLSFLRHPNTDDVVARYDLDAVKTAVKNILNTNKGEKLFNPAFGADLHGLLFELLTSSTKLLIKRRIIEEIQRWEPRVIVGDVQVAQTNEGGEVVINLIFSLRNRPEVQSSVNIKLQRAR